MFVRYLLSEGRKKGKIKVEKVKGWEKFVSEKKSTDNSLILYCYARYDKWTKCSYYLVNVFCWNFKVYTGTGKVQQGG